MAQKHGKGSYNDAVLQLPFLESGKGRSAFFSGEVRVPGAAR